MKRILLAAAVLLGIAGLATYVNATDTVLDGTLHAATTLDRDQGLAGDTDLDRTVALKNETKATVFDKDLGVYIQTLDNGTLIEAALDAKLTDEKSGAGLTTTDNDFALAKSSAGGDDASELTIKTKL